MSDNGEQRHIGRAELHAHARGEVDPAHKAVIEAHLEICEECRERRRQVVGVTEILTGMGTADLDDLRWRRIRDAVRAELEAHAQQPPPTTADLMSGRRWIIPATAAGVAIGLMVWGAIEMRRRTPGPEVSAPSPTPVAVDGAPGAPDDRAPVRVPAEARPPKDAPDAQALASGAAPLTVTLASGAKLELEPRTRLRAIRPLGPSSELELATGALRVRLPRPPAAHEAPVLKTPAFRLVALSDDFSAGFWADRYFIAVRSGEVRVEGNDFEGETIIPAGERREVRASVARRAVGRDVDPKERKPAPKRVSPSVGGSASAAVSTSEPGEVTVDVEPPDDPVLLLWRQATDAYYRQRNLTAAIGLAREVVELGGRHSQPAQQLVCDAQIGLGNAQGALQDCKALLNNARSAEDRRNIHYTVGTIYRALLGDCARAIEHYNKALVFGRRHLLDDEVRLFRAQCALETGDIALAERDIGSLSARAGRLARPEEVTLLQSRLKAAKKGVNDASVTTD